MYLLQTLDSVQKNIGEAIAVVVIYISQVSLPGFGDKTFELSVFLLAVLVVGLVRTYLISGAAKSKAKTAQRLRVVALNDKGTPLMENLGISTIQCEAAEGLPDGVFYGMLGGVHPVCGSRQEDNSHMCELMMLSHPPLKSDEHPGTRTGVPFMATKSLTVLGHVRDRLPLSELTGDQFMSDLSKARGQLVGLMEGPGSTWV